MFLFFRGPLRGLRTRCEPIPFRALFPAHSACRRLIDRETAFGRIYFQPYFPPSRNTRVRWVARFEVIFTCKLPSKRQRACSSCLLSYEHWTSLAQNLFRQGPWLAALGFSAHSDQLVQQFCAILWTRPLIEASMLYRIGTTPLNGVCATKSFNSLSPVYIFNLRIFVCYFMLFCACWLVPRVAVICFSRLRPHKRSVSIPILSMLCCGIVAWIWSRLTFLNF